MKKFGLFAFILVFLFCGTNAFAYSIGFEDMQGGNIVFNIESVEGGDAGSEQTKITITNSGSADISDISFRGLEDLVSLIRFEEELTEDQVIFDDMGTEAAVHHFTYKTKNKHRKFMLEQGESAVFMVDKAFDAVVTATANGGLTEIIAHDTINEVKYSATITPTSASVPEPATMLLLGAGLVGIAGLGRKKLFKKK